jgi:hypothetical protein
MTKANSAGDAVAQRHVGNRIQVQLKGFNALLEFVGDDNASNPPTSPS